VPGASRHRHPHLSSGKNAGYSPTGTPDHLSRNGLEEGQGEGYMHARLASSSTRNGHTPIQNKKSPRMRLNGGLRHMGLMDHGRPRDARETRLSTAISSGWTRSSAGKWGDAAVAPCGC